MFRTSATSREYCSVTRIQAATGQACEAPAFDPVLYDGDVIRARLAAGFAVVIPAGAPHPGGPAPRDGEVNVERENAGRLACLAGRKPDHVTRPTRWNADQ